MIDLLVTDVIMPGMNGPALAKQVRALRPEIKVLYMTGYSGEFVRSDMLVPGVSFIQKPFTPADLRRKIRKMLADKPAQPRRPPPAARTDHWRVGCPQRGSNFGILLHPRGIALCHLHPLFNMPQIQCQAILFDLDGVLIDSTRAVARVWHRWAVEHGFDPDEVVARAHGRPSLTTVREYLPHADHAAENREVERREMEDLEGVVLLPGSLRLLTELPPDRWTIVTSCTRPLAETRLRAAGLPVPERMITSNDIKNGKPHPEPYLKGASVLGFSATDCVVIEDVPAGIRAGKAAGATVIAFRTTVKDPELKAAGADWVLDNCSEISVAGKSPDLTLAPQSTTQPRRGRCPRLPSRAQLDGSSRTRKIAELRSAGQMRTSAPTWFVALPPLPVG